MTGHRPHRIVFANEKGGTGKSTPAGHVAVALAYQGARVAAIDLDHRQRTMDRYFENRDETARRRKISLPTAACAVFSGGDEAALEEKARELAEDADFLIFDTRMPRSLAYCYDTITHQLDCLFRQYGQRLGTHDLAESLEASLTATTIESVFENGLHEFLSDFLRRNASLSAQIETDFRFAE